MPSASFHLPLIHTRSSPRSPPLHDSLPIRSTQTSPVPPAAALSFRSSGRFRPAARWPVPASRWPVGSTLSAAACRRVCWTPCSSAARLLCSVQSSAAPAPRFVCPRRRFPSGWHPHPGWYPSSCHRCPAAPSGRSRRRSPPPHNGCSSARIRCTQRPPSVLPPRICPAHPDSRAVPAGKVPPRWCCSAQSCTGSPSFLRPWSVLPAVAPALRSCPPRPCAFSAGRSHRRSPCCCSAPYLRRYSGAGCNIRRRSSA